MIIYIYLDGTLASQETPGMGEVQGGQLLLLPCGAVGFQTVQVGVEERGLPWGGGDREQKEREGAGKMAMSGYVTI